MGHRVITSVLSCTRLPTFWRWYSTTDGRFTDRLATVAVLFFEACMKTSWALSSVANILAGMVATRKFLVADLEAKMLS